ncbi:MAG TPA: hypothetical protein VGG64_14025 [Pirellulales bacterium]
MSTGQANVRTGAYKRQLRQLPQKIQSAADDAFRLFLQNSAHPLLDAHALTDTKKGRHRNGSRAISVTYRYRAIYVVDGPTNVWYWIGSHEDYNNFVGKI